jgi:predicted permease
MNEQTIAIINRVLPILLLLLLGYWFRRTKFLSESIVEGLRQLVVNVALPAVLFLSFLNIDLQLSFVVLSVIVFSINVGLYLVGRFLGPRLAPAHPYFPFLMTGFEYGMLAISLFGSAYGLAQIGIIAVVDLGHELFIWFVFLPLLLARRDGTQRPGELLRSFIKSPVVVAIIAALVLNIAGLRNALFDWPVTGGIMATLDFLAALVIPLILLTVGYGIKLDRAGFGVAARVVLIRLALIMPTLLLLNYLLVRGMLRLGTPYEVAIVTLFIAPPPFIIPLFMDQSMLEERRFVNNVLTLHTVVTIVIFVIFFVFNPTL